MILRNSIIKSQASNYPLHEGIYAVFKPRGVTSYDVIRQIKKISPKKKIGHGGTLDPLATGVLVVAVGSKFTKQLGVVLNNTVKSYKVEIELGKISDTYDCEGPIHKLKVLNVPSRSDIESVLHKYQGKIKQIPPNHSAIKIKGVPAYVRARRGEVLKIKPKDVIVDKLTIIKYDFPFLKLTVDCHSGVYIRSLANDIGSDLGCGGYVVSLTRTQVGPYSL